jgi:hypothetical protein
MVTPNKELLPALYHALLLEFLAELLNATHTADTPDAFPHAVQRFCEELRPWLMPGDMPPKPRAVFALLAECTMEEATDLLTVQLSPEGEALFRAWVRRQAVLTERLSGNWSWQKA